jgi:hypothetical protein
MSSLCQSRPPTSRLRPTRCRHRQMMVNRLRPTTLLRNARPKRLPLPPPLLPPQLRLRRRRRRKRRHRHRRRRLPRRKRLPRTRPLLTRPLLTRPLPTELPLKRPLPLSAPPPRKRPRKQLPQKHLKRVVRRRLARRRLPCQLASLRHRASSCPTRTIFPTSQFRSRSRRSSASHRRHHVVG